MPVGLLSFMTVGCVDQLQMLVNAITFQLLSPTSWELRTNKISSDGPQNLFALRPVVLHLAPRVLPRPKLAAVIQPERHRGQTAEQIDLHPRTEPARRDVAAERPDEPQYCVRVNEEGLRRRYNG